mmetsp:Transcript_13433/g.26780  ORF Transcript_13433/g.26780 Transcript_13433/m.26780 type:complete len:281 (+) Transcript_13433:804-1646(+)
MSLGRAARSLLYNHVARQGVFTGGCCSSSSCFASSFLHAFSRAYTIESGCNASFFRSIGDNLKRRWNSGWRLSRIIDSRYNNNYGNGMIWSIIGINGAVYLLWKSNPRFCQRHFVLTGSSVYSRPHTLVTNAFSHPEFGNLAANMIALYFFGANVARLFGGKTVLGLYLAGSLASNITHLYAGQWSHRRFGRRDTPLYGARGSVQSIGIVSILMYPQQTILLYGLIPMPAALLGLLWVWNDLGGILDGYPSSSPLNNAGNFMGIVTGVLYYLSFRYRRRW